MQTLWTGGLARWLWDWSSSRFCGRKELVVEYVVLVPHDAHSLVAMRAAGFRTLKSSCRVLDREAP